MKYTVKAWIPVEADDPELYDTREEAEKAIADQLCMQPENKYEVEEIEDAPCPYCAGVGTFSQGGDMARELTCDKCHGTGIEED